ncbi:MAG: hemolysin family protein [Alphaproteobacteria bacterium]|nr:hemolysin family protein [Alphaproteobacteria bacterium]
MKMVSEKKSKDEKSKNFWVVLWQKLVHLFRAPSNAEALREIVEELVEDPLSASGLSSAERTALSNILKLRERRVIDCMVPRADIVALDVSVSLKELADEMSINGYSRIPIFRGTLDDVIGMVHVKDIVPFLAQQKPCVIPDILRPVLYVAPSMPASKLLLQMRQTRQHMAVVIDEFGGVDGLVTIEDVVEEIIGEIEDEHDIPPPPPVVVRPDGTLLADARLPIESFERQTGLLLPSPGAEDIDTLGGYVLHLAGRVPQVGEIVQSPDGISFEILEIEQSRVNRLRIRAPRRTPEEK